MEYKLIRYSNDCERYPEVVPGSQQAVGAVTYQSIDESATPREYDTDRYLTTWWAHALFWLFDWGLRELGQVSA